MPNVFTSHMLDRLSALKRTIECISRTMAAALKPSPKDAVSRQ